MAKTKNTPVSFRIDLHDYELFQKQYPYVMSKFLRLCIKKAAADKEFFYSIFFGESND